MQFSFPFFPSNLHFWYEGHCLWNRFLHTYILISCILSQESHFQVQNFRNCILLGFRDILRCWEVFQCLQEDVFKPGKANYLSFKSWRWHHGAHIFASAGLASWMNSEFPQENVFLCVCGQLCVLREVLHALSPLPGVFAQMGICLDFLPPRGGIWPCLGWNRKRRRTRGLKRLNLWWHKYVYFESQRNLDKSLTVDHVISTFVTL